MTTINDNDSIDILWGAEAIGAAIGVKRRRAFYLLENGLIPGKQIGGRWVARKSELKSALSSAGQAVQR